jgi:hypothetical protein
VVNSPLRITSISRTYLLALIFLRAIIAFSIAFALYIANVIGSNPTVIYRYTPNISKISIYLLGLIVLLIALNIIYKISSFFVLNLISARIIL